MLNRKAIKLSLVDAAVILSLVAAAALFFSKENSFISYQWEWQAIPGYFFFFDSLTGELRANILLKGFITTVKLSLWATLTGMFLGTFSGIFGAKGSFGQRLISRLYVETVRNIPSLVLVILFYYFISSQFLDALHLDRWLRTSSPWVQDRIGFLFSEPGRINAFVSAILALGIYEGAYISEIVRSGILAIPEGQWEASRSIGLTRKKTFMLVILPQAFRRVAFPMAGQFISTIKDSAIVSVISIQELTFQGMELMNATFLTFEIWITITALYFILTFSISRTVASLEKKYALHQ